MAMNEREPLWSRTDHILADLIDVTNYNTWALVNKDHEPRNRSKLPEPYERPGMAKSEPVITADKLRDFARRTQGGT